MFNLKKYQNILDENKKRNDLEYAPDHISSNDNEGSGFALDGPIVPEIWNQLSLKVLFILKETYGMDGCDTCKIMGNPDKFNDSKTNLQISKVSYCIHETISNGFVPSVENTNNLSPEALKVSFSKIAIVEVKKTSGETTSNDGLIRDHSRFNKEFLCQQIQLINPNIIICGGLVTWHSLTLDMGLFDRQIYNLNDERKAFKCEDKIIYNGYHPSFSRFKPVEVTTTIYNLWKKVN